jgi:hypothetical protein
MKDPLVFLLKLMQTLLRPFDIGVHLADGTIHDLARYSGKVFSADDIDCQLGRVEFISVECVEPRQVDCVVFSEVLFLR